MKTNRIPQVLAIFALLGLAIFHATAADRTWDGAAGTWDTPTNWNGGVLPASSDDTVINNSGTAQLPVGVSGSYNSLGLGTTSGGSGTIQITEGLLSGGAASLGTHAAGMGAATVTSGTWNNSGDLTVGREGTGHLTLTGGEVVVGSGTITLAEQGGSFGTLNLGEGVTVGALNAAEVNGGSGTAQVNFNHAGQVIFAPTLTGSLTVNKSGVGTTVLTAANTYSGGTVVQDGGLIFGDALSVPGTGSITNQSYTGFSFEFDNTILNQFDKANSSGTVGLNADNASDLDFTGFHSDARLGTTQTGITFSGSITPQGSTYRFGGGNGQMIVSSDLTGSSALSLEEMTLTLAGNNDYSGGTTVKSGTLEVKTGGVINHASETMIVGDGSGNAGALLISGGLVSNGSGSIGNDAGSNGSATVTSGTWSNSNSLSVSNSGTGSLLVNGGLVTSGSGVIGHASSGHGSATVASGTWNNSGDLTVGREGTGHLTLTGGEVVVGSGTLTLAEQGGSTGTLNLGEGGTVGTLNAAEVTGGSGTAQVNFDHAGQVTFAPTLTGSLAVNKSGVGTSILTGANTYSGGTTVQGGKLIFDSALSVPATGTITNQSYTGFGFAFDNAILNQFDKANSSGTIGLNANNANNLDFTDFHSDARLGTTQTGILYSGSITPQGSVYRFGGGNGQMTVSSVLSGSSALSLEEMTLNLTGSNTYTGGTTVKSGTLAVGTNGVINHSAETMIVGDGIGNTGALSISGGLVSNSSGTLGNDAGSNGSATVTSGTWSNSGDLTVGREGTGSLTLTGGGVVVGSGSGTLTLAEQGGSTGTFNLGQGGAVGTLSAGEVTGGAGTPQVNFDHTGQVTFAPALTGSLSVKKTGTGTTVLTGTNTYTGNTTIEDGTLTAGAANALSTDSIINLMSNLATLDTGTSDQTIGGLAGFGIVQTTANKLTLDNDSNSTFFGVIHGTGQLVKKGTGELTLQNSTNDYSGGTSIEEGSLKVTLDENLGALAGGLSIADGTLRLASSPIAFISSRKIALSGTATVDTGSRTATLSNNISGPGALAKKGSASLTLTGSNSYLGTIIEEGAIWVNSDARLGNASGEVTLNGGTLGVTASTASARKFILDTEGGAINTADGTTFTISGDIEGTSLIKNGTGLLVLTGSNSYQDGTTINAGTLRYSSANAVAPGPLTLNGGMLSSAVTFTTNKNLTLTASSAFEVLPSQTVTWDGVVSGTGKTLTKTGAGTLNLTNAANDFARTRITSGTVGINSDAGVGQSVTLAGGTILFNNGMNFDKNISVEYSYYSLNALDTSSNTVTFGGALSGNSGNTLVKNGSGTLIFSGSSSNSFAGTFSIQQGTVQAEKVNAFVSNQGITIANAATLDLNSYNNKIQNLNGSAGAQILLGTGNTLTLNGAGTYEGLITGGGAIVKTGSGTQVLSRGASPANNYTGGTLVQSGGLIFGNASSVPATGSITNQSYTGFTFAFDNTILNQFNKADSSGIVGLNADNTNILDFTGFHSDARLGTTIGGWGVDYSGVLTPQGSTYRFGGGGGRINASGNYTGASLGLNVAAGTLFLSGSNSYGQGSVVESGAMLVFVNADSLPGSGSLQVQSGAYLGNAFAVNQAFLDKFDKGTSAGTIGVNVSTSTSLDLTGFHANTRLGTTESGITIFGAITPQGSTYRFGGGNGEMTVSSGLTGSRSVSIEQITLTLAGSNSYTGGTTIGSGSILQVDSDSRLGSGGTLDIYGTFRPTASFSTSRGINAHSGGQFDIGNGITTTLTGALDGNGISKYGDGELALGSTSSSIDSVTIYGGTLRTLTANTLTPDTSFYISSYATLALNGISRSLGNLSNNGTADLGSAVLTVQQGYNNGEIIGAGSLVKNGPDSLNMLGVSNYSGGTILNEGTLYVSGASSLGSGNLALDGGTLLSDYSFTDSRSISTSGTSTIATSDERTLTLSGAFSGSGSLVKSGAGSLVLSGTSSHNGLIKVEAGTVKLAGSTASDISVETLGTMLTGTGSTLGGIVIAHGGILSPGNSPGTLQVGSAEFGKDGNYDWEISSPGIHDLLESDGVIEITATNANPFTINVLTLNGNNSTGFMEGFDMTSNYTWMIASGSSISGFAQNKFLLDLSGFYNDYLSADQFAIRQQGDSLVLEYHKAAAVPEPGSLALLLLGGGVLLIGRRRRRS